MYRLSIWFYAPRQYFQKTPRIPCNVLLEKAQRSTYDEGSFTLLRLVGLRRAGENEVTCILSIMSNFLVSNGIAKPVVALPLLYLQWTAGHFDKDTILSDEFDGGRDVKLSVQHHRGFDLDRRPGFRCAYRLAQVYTQT